jgi:hypothetical protein
VGTDTKIILGVFVFLVTATVGLVYNDVAVKRAAFAQGYEQRVLPGRGEFAWVKAYTDSAVTR